MASRENMNSRHLKILHVISITQNLFMSIFGVSSFSTLSIRAPVRSDREMFVS